MLGEERRTDLASRDRAIKLFCKPIKISALTRVARAILPEISKGDLVPMSSVISVSQSVHKYPDSISAAK